MVFVESMLLEYRPGWEHLSVVVVADFAVAVAAAVVAVVALLEPGLALV